MKKYVLRKKFYQYNDEGHELILPTELVAVLNDHNIAVEMKSKLEKEAYILYILEIIGITDYPFEHRETWKVVKDFEEKYPSFKKFKDSISDEEYSDYAHINKINPFENEQQLDEFIVACKHDFYFLEEVKEEILHYVVLRNEEFWENFEDAQWAYIYSYEWVLNIGYDIKKISFKNREEALRFAYCETMNFTHRFNNLACDFPELMKDFYEKSKYIKCDYENKSLVINLDFYNSMSVFVKSNFQAIDEVENQVIIEEFNTWYGLLKIKPFEIVGMTEEEFKEFSY